MGRLFSRVSAITASDGGPIPYVGLFGSRWECLITGQRAFFDDTNEG